MADIIITERGVLVPIERWRDLAQLVCSTATQLGVAADYMIERCDEFDGDCDLEEDDPQGACDEDEISTNLGASRGGGAGCLLSDDDSEHDGREPEDGV